MKWHVRTYQPGDESQILDLFNRVFRQNRSLEHWRWKFADNPAGQHITVAVSNDGAILGQFAGLPVLAATAERTLVLTQGIDHMVNGAHRRSGVFTAMSHSFFETFLGPGRAAAWYGYHVPEIHEIEARAFGCTTLHRVKLLEWDLSRAEDWRPSETSRDRYRITRTDRYGPAIDSLWARCRPALGLAAVRDSRYLNWRYADCPDIDYTLLQATDRATQEAAGLAVVRFGWLDRPVAPIVDWLVPDAEAEAADALLAHCHDLARERNQTAVQAWFPEHTSPHRMFLHRGYRTEPSQFLLCAVGPPGSEVPRLMNGRWYYTMGDSDIY